MQTRDRTKDAGPAAHTGHLPWWMMVTVLAVALSLAFLGAPRVILAVGPQGPVAPPSDTAGSLLRPVHTDAPHPAPLKTPPLQMAGRSGEGTASAGPSIAGAGPSTGAVTSLAADAPSLFQTGRTHVEWEDALTQYASRASRTRGQPAAV